MNNINQILAIVAGLMAFYVVVMLYIKFGYKQSFTPLDSGIPAVEQKPELVPMKVEKNVYETEDTRMQYPLIPPVSPMVRQTIIKDTIPASPELYSSQGYESREYLLDTPPTPNTNELLYSGGDTKMISVPLQMNWPYDEQLRSFNTLVTPYNKIKYGNC